MGRLFDEDDDFELERQDEEMNVWDEDGYVFVEVGETGTRTLDPERAREMAEAMERSAENHGENNDELYQAEMLKRAADRADDAE